MNIINIDDLKSPRGEVAIFQGAEHAADVSFFVVEFSHGQGPKRHRHPYEETFILLNGEIEIILDGATQTVSGRKVVVIPAGAWHEFKVRSQGPVSMINLHPTPKMITEWA